MGGFTCKLHWRIVTVEYPASPPKESPPEVATQALYGAHVQGGDVVQLHVPGAPAESGAEPAESGAVPHPIWNLLAWSTAGLVLHNGPGMQLALPAAALCRYVPSAMDRMLLSGEPIPGFPRPGNTMENPQWLQAYFNVDHMDYSEQMDFCKENENLWPLEMQPEISRLYRKFLDLLESQQRLRAPQCQQRAIGMFVAYLARLNRGRVPWGPALAWAYQHEFICELCENKALGTYIWPKLTVGGSLNEFPFHEHGRHALKAIEHTLVITGLLHESSQNLQNVPFIQNFAATKLALNEKYLSDFFKACTGNLKGPEDVPSNWALALHNKEMLAEADFWVQAGPTQTCQYFGPDTPSSAWFLHGLRHYCVVWQLDEATRELSVKWWKTRTPANAREQLLEVSEAETIMGPAHVGSKPHLMNSFVGDLVVRVDGLNMPSGSFTFRETLMCTYGGHSHMVYTHLTAPAGQGKCKGAGLQHLELYACDWVSDRCKQVLLTGFDAEQGYTEARGVRKGTEGYIKAGPSEYDSHGWVKQNKEAGSVLFWYTDKTNTTHTLWQENIGLPVWLAKGQGDWKKLPGTPQAINSAKCV